MKNEGHRNVRVLYLAENTKSDCIRFIAFPILNTIQ